MILAATLPSVPATARPLRIQVEQAGPQLIINLVGSSPVAWSAQYDLEVTGGARGSSNRSAQRGSARLQPGRETTVATVRLSNAASASWIARLHVTPAAGEPYDIEWHSQR